MGCHDRTWTDIDNPVFKESVAITDFQLSYFWPANYYTQKKKKKKEITLMLIPFNYPILIYIFTHSFTF